jgi:hypothetical protein
LLARHFLRSFLDNDLSSPGEDLHVPLTAFLAVGLSTVAGAATIFYQKYNRVPPLPLAEKLAMAVDEKVLFLGCAMIATALATLLVWKSLSLDRRDAAVLGPLPVGAGTILLAKAAGLAILAGALVAALSVPPAIVFPGILLMDSPVSLPYALRSIGAQAVGATLACAFAFLALVSLRGLVSLLLPPAAARRVLTALQCLLVPALLAVLLMMPVLAGRTRPTLDAGRAAASRWPPLWFLGVNEVLIGREVPVLEDLAAVGVTAFLAAVLAAGVTYLLAFRRDLGRLRDGGPASPSRRARARAALVERTGAVLVADPIARAGYAFTVLTLARSARHRLYLAAYLGVGFALACASMVANIPGLDRTTLALAAIPLAVQFNLLLFLVVGVRIAATEPVELRAAWLFRILATASLSRYLAGVRCAVFALGVVPLLVLLAPVHLLLWGWYVAAVHAVWGLAFALAAWTALFRGFDRLPFACAATPGRARLTTRFLFYVVAYLLAVYTPAAFEAALIERRGLAIGWAALAAACAILVVRRQPHSREGRLPSFDVASGEVQRLGLEPW